MHLVMSVLQVVVSLVLLSVWLIRSQQATPFRGGNAQSMREEFAVYGLPPFMMVLVGVLKVGAALCLLVGLFHPALVFPAAVLVFVLMVGAVGMHLRVHDAPLKLMPAAMLLLFSACIAYLSRP